MCRGASCEVVLFPKAYQKRHGRQDGKVIVVCGRLEAEEETIKTSPKLSVDS